MRNTMKMLMKLIYNFRAKRLSKLLATVLEKEHIALVDIGAAGEIQPRWRRISSLIDYIGFEPDERSYKDLIKQETQCNSYKIYNSAVWSREGSLSINFCKKPMASSHFNPNRTFVDKFSDSERFDVVSQEEINITRLDELDIDKVDFIKLDIQGGEIEALKGGENLLTQCLGLEVEVEFLPMYESQPLFGDVCQYLKEKGFEFIDFTSINRWERKKYGYGQAVFGDALFLKTPETIIEKFGDRDTTRRYIAICALYGRFDLIDALNIDEAWSQPLDSLRKYHRKAKRRFTLLNKFFLFCGGNFFAHLIY